MNKVIVTVTIPRLRLEYDVWIPLNRRIYNVINLMVKALNEFTDGEYVPERLPELYEKKTAKLYDLNMTVGEANIKNGTELILI